MHGCEPRNFLKPRLLLLLLDGAAHGYALIQRLRPFEVTEGDPGHVYRALRSLERDGLVSSAWVPSRSGPARRMYRLTSTSAPRLPRDSGPARVGKCGRHLPTLDRPCPRCLHDEPQGERAPSMPGMLEPAAA